MTAPRPSLHSVNVRAASTAPVAVGYESIPSDGELLAARLDELQAR